MTKNNNTYYRRKIQRQRHHRRRQLFDGGVGIVVIIIFIFALGQGNLKKDVKGQEEIRPESGTLAQLSDEQNASDDADQQDIVNGDLFDDKIYTVSQTVDNSYFDTSILIGDSRAETLGLYSDAGSWDMCAAKNLDVEKVVSTKMFTGETGQQCTVIDILGEKNYKSIYISFGTEELSWYNERYISAYRTMLDRITELRPAADIYVMSLLPVTASLSYGDKVYNNPNIDKLNSLVKELCGQNEHVIYLDVASSVSENGVLPEDAGIDGIHCNKEYCGRIMDYIRRNVYVRR